MVTLLLMCLLASADALSDQSGIEPTPPPAVAGWPGLWGPTRDGNATAHGAPERPRAFKELWRRRTAGGYSEIVVDGGRAFTMELNDGVDHVVALDPLTGRDRWRAPVGPTYRGHEGSHDGPISTPAVAGRDVFAVGPHGHLVALEAESGRERWRHDLVKEFQATPPAYGFGTSPLVEGGAVIVQTGGEKSLGLLAFDRATGRRLWSASHGARSSYSSPAVARLAGTRQILAAAGDRVYAVAPDDGRLLWSVAGPGDGEGVANAPIVLPDDRVLLTFWGEAVLVRVARQGDAFTATEVWRSPRLRGAYGPTVYRDGYLYGFNGSFLICLDVATSEVRWRQRTYEGTLVGAGRHLFVLARGSGTLHVVEASPGGFTEVARTEVFTAGATSITGPSVVGGRVYLRNLEEMVAFAIEG
jgi:outer membrane protein assembly factor BamB